MRKKGRLLFLIALTASLAISGCRKRSEEPQTESETVTESEKVTETEKITEKPTEKETQKESETGASTAKKTTVKPSNVSGSGTAANANKSKTTVGTNGAGSTTTGPTQQCPYCYQQISTASNGDGTTIYSQHVAQEKAWAELNGYGDTPPANQSQTDAQGNTTDDSRQCGYCYQWFSVSDGSYAAHIQAENAALGLPQDTQYIVCPKCGNSYPAGSLYDNHVCVGE